MSEYKWIEFYESFAEQLYNIYKEGKHNSVSTAVIKASLTEGSS